MVKITNGVNVVSVTEGAYNTIYKSQGFYLAKEVKAEPIETELKEENLKTVEELFIEEILEKPISEWNKNEVKQFADIKGVDIAGTKNPTEAKAIISKWLEENE